MCPFFSLYKVHFILSLHILSRSLYLVLFAHQPVIVCDKRDMQQFLRFCLTDKLEFCNALSLYHETANLTSDVVICAKAVPLMDWRVH